MPFAEVIAGIINQTLKGSSLNKKQFQPGSYNGLASIIGRKNAKGDLELIPGILDGSGNYTPVIPDQKFNLVIYHKLLTNEYGYDKKNSYGEAYDVRCTSQMMMVVWGDGKKIGITAEQLEAMIVFGMPQMLSSIDRQNLGLKTCMISPISTNMDRLQVFRQEYQQVEFFLKPNDALFLVRYKIETSFGQSCIDLCCT